MSSPNLQDVVDKYVKAKTNISPISKLFILYEEVARRLNLVKDAISNQDLVDKSENLNAAIRIILGTAGLLDHNFQHKEITKLFEKFYYSLVLNMQNLTIEDEHADKVDSIIADTNLISNVLRDKLNEAGRSEAKESTSEISLKYQKAFNYFCLFR